jgi:hypothetical protein
VSRRPPPAVKVGNYSFEVRVVSGPEMDRRGVAAVFDGPHGVIDLRTDHGDTNAQDSLLHEVLHATVYAHGLGKPLGLDHDGEENLVCLLAPALLGVLRGNPALVRYLTAGT